MTEQLYLVNSSTHSKALSEIELENHNSVSADDCETCGDKSSVGDTVKLGCCDVFKPSVIQMSNVANSDIIVIDDDDDVDNISSERMHSRPQDTGTVSKVYEEEVVISSTTSPDRDCLLKEAGLLTNSLVNYSSLSRKRMSAKAESIFEIFSQDKVDSTDDLINVKHGSDTNPRESTAEVDLCDSTENTSLSGRPALFSIFDPVSNSLDDLGSKVNAKECSENKSNPDSLRRNIFEVLAQETSLHPADGEDVNDVFQKSFSASPVEGPRIKRSKLSVESSHCKGTDFESATGESQFNFYNSNELVKHTGMDSSSIIYNDCYMAEEGDLQSLQNTYSSLQSDDNECHSQGGHTPSKYAFLSQDSTNVRDVLSIHDMSTMEESPRLEKPEDSQCKLSPVLPSKGFKKTPSKTRHQSDSCPVKITDWRGSGVRSSSDWTMSSRQIKCFQNSHQRLVLLRRKVCKFLRVAFPFLQYPAYFKTHAICVENLLDQLICIIDRSKGNHSQHAIPTELSCCEVRVVICKSPRQCLNYLRRKIVRFLQSVLPDMKMSPCFDTSSEMVETLLQQIIICNQNHDNSS